jgi:hypothetical protein
MNTIEAKRMVNRMDALEGQIQTLNQTVSDMVASVTATQTKVEGDYDAFTNSLNTNMGGAVSSSIDVAKAKIIEDLQAYIDSRITEAMTAVVGVARDPSTYEDQAEE